MRITKKWDDAAAKYLVKIEAGNAGELVGDNVLIRYFADKLTSEGTNVREIPDGVEFDHDFDGVATL